MTRAMIRAAWLSLTLAGSFACGAAPERRAEERRASLARVPPEVWNEYQARRASLRPAVVSLRTVVGRKTGALIDPRGLILTCLHGSAPGMAEEVGFADGKTGTARVRASSPDLDLALLELSSPPGPFPALRLANQAGAGEWIFLERPGAASGREEAAAGQPVLVGIPLAYGPQDTYVHSGLLVSLPAFPGDSGAPLLNAQGQLVGIALGSAYREGSDLMCGASMAGIQEALPLLLRGQSLDRMSGAEQIQSFLDALARPIPALAGSRNPAFVQDYRAKLNELDLRLRSDWKGQARLTAELTREALAFHYREISALLDRYGLLR